jgi:acetyltransferase
MLYQIHRYPADLIDTVGLPDGQRVVVRPVLPQDEALTDAYFRDLRAASRYDRFLGPMRTLPAGLVAHLTHIDYSSHLALVAEVFVEAGDRDRRPLRAAR